MSTIKVEVTRIGEVRPHPNADALELATVGGWQMCVKKGVYQNGDAIVYFEQGTTLPREVADRLGVTQYLSEKMNIDGEKVLVIHRVRLRGEPSFGLVTRPEAGMEVGQDVAEHYGAAKFFPPVKTSAGDSAPSDPRFPAYTEIENMRSYPAVMVAGEEVVATEKLHGTNCRVGYVTEVTDGARRRVLMAGSRGLRRKEPEGGAAAYAMNTYWFPFTMEAVGRMLEGLFAAGHDQAVLYGEVIGPRVQSYTYGQTGLAFRAFDLMLDGVYVGHDEFARRCSEFGVAMVPLVYRGGYWLEAIRGVSEGDSLVGGKHGREGVVVRPVKERTDAAVGRVILKYIGDQYLFGKAGGEDTTDL